MRLAWIGLAVFLAACGYRPAAGRISADVDPGVRYAPFRVANDTPELALTHVVLEASRAELGRRRVLAEQADDPENHLLVELRIRRITEYPASYSPNSTIIEYFGELGVDYRVYREGATAPVIATSGERLTYRYDYRQNPQDIRLYRHAAIADAVRAWIPQFLWRTRHGLRNPATVPVPVTGATDTGSE